MPMSRAEAICACNNIVELVEEMGDKLPDTFSSSVDAKARSMLEYILKTPQYPRVTEKMDGALRGMWRGLRKWDHNGAYNDNLFDGVEAVIRELQAVQNTFNEAEGGEESSNDTPLGLEEMSDDLPHYAAVKDAQDKESLRSVTPQAPQAPLAPRQVGLPLEDIVKVREEMISQVLNQVHEKHITAVDTRGIRHGITQDILKKTSSDRTTQLLWAMYYAGKVSGILQLGEELATEAGKK